MRLVIFFINLSLLLMISSCGLFSASNDSTYEKNKNYLNDFEKSIPAHWLKIQSEGSDLAIQNKNTNSIFLLNSACRKHESSSLSSLTSAILTGIESVEILYKKSITISDRDALEMRAMGKLDGAKTFLNIITLQKNFCIYDFVLISTSLKKLELDYQNYENFIARIKLQ